VKWIPPHTVYVVASRQTHAWIRGYLSAVDRPQRIIAFEVKFIETSRNPTEQLGIAAPTSASATFHLTQGYQVLGKASTAAGAAAAATASAATGGPFGVLMNTSDLAFTINALQSDSRTEDVSFMQEATIENRPVELKNSTKVPVLDSSTSTSSGVSTGSQGALQTTAVTEKEVGTFVQLRPQIIDGNAVKVDIAVTVTDIIGTVPLNGNDYPETAERSYNAPVIVRDGSSIAIAGLEKTSITRSFRKTPGLGDIPLLGKAFQSTNDTRKKQVLYIFITPRILNGYSGGIESVARGGNLGRPFALRYVPGLAQSVDDVRYNSEGIGRQVDDFYTKFEANTLSKDDKLAIADLASDVSALAEDLAQVNRARFSPEGRQLADQLGEAQRRLDYLRRYFQIAGN
jgi:type II secretory pathway component GspD/PulD (secretin)